MKFVHVQVKGKAHEFGAGTQTFYFCFSYIIQTPAVEIEQIHLNFCKFEELFFKVQQILRKFVEVKVICRNTSSLVNPDLNLEVKKCDSRSGSRVARKIIFFLDSPLCKQSNFWGTLSHGKTPGMFQCHTLNSLNPIMQPYWIRNQF